MAQPYRAPGRSSGQRPCAARQAARTGRAPCALWRAARQAVRTSCGRADRLRPRSAGGQGQSTVPKQLVPHVRGEGLRILWVACESEAGADLDAVLDAHGPGAVGPGPHDLDGALGGAALNSVVTARGAASVLAASLGAGLEVVGADLPTIGLGLEVVEQVPGLLRGFNR